MIGVAAVLKQGASNTTRLENLISKQMEQGAKSIAMEKMLVQVCPDIRMQAAIEEIKSNGFWLIDIPRTSSTSVRVELGQEFGPTYAKTDVMERKYGNDQYVKNHMKAAVLMEKMGRQAFDNLLTFTIVRNPWARAFSFYSYRKRVKSIPDEWSFTEYCTRLCDEENHGEYFKYPPYKNRIVDHICDDEGKILVKRIIRFEERREQIRELAKDIGFEALGSLHVQRTSQLNLEYKSHYTAETKKMIGDYYAQDVELFGYEF
jgi:hypothetical protein